MVRLQLILLLLAGAAFGGPRILIVTDMEGVGGVNNADEQLLPGQRRYDESRHLLAGELNAAVEGAFQAGASEVVVWDGHDGSRSLSIEDVDPRARLLQGSPHGELLSFRPGLRCHLLRRAARHGRRERRCVGPFAELRRRAHQHQRPRGRRDRAGAAIAGCFHIPVVMLAGDQAACEEMRELQPKAETVAVKRLAGKDSTLSLSHPEAEAADPGGRGARGDTHFRAHTVEGRRSGRAGVQLSPETQRDSGAFGGVQGEERAGGL